MLYTLNITLDGTAQPLVATAGLDTNLATWVMLQAPAGNSASAYIGGDSTVTTSGTTKGFELAKGTTVTLQQVSTPGPYNLNKIYLIGTSNDTVMVLYFRR